jgi:hypothetical protein
VPLTVIVEHENRRIPLTPRYLVLGIQGLRGLAGDCREH